MSKPPQFVLRTLDRDASAYKRLSKIFADGDNLSIGWVNKSEKMVGAFVYNTGGGGSDYHFSLTEIGEVCPSLKDTLLSLLSNKTNVAVARIARVLWKHCTKPGICVEHSDGLEIYARTIYEINSMDTNERSIVVKCDTYMLNTKIKKARSKKGEDTLVVVGGLGMPLTIKNQKLKLVYLEETFPGVTQRIETALELGLSPKEVADYALVTTTFSEVLAGAALLPSLTP